MITSFKKVAKYQLYNVSVARSKAPYIILSSNMDELGIVQAMKITDNPKGLPILMEGGKVRYIYPDRYYTFFKKTFETLYPFGHLENDVIINENLGALLRDMFLEMNDLPMLHHNHIMYKVLYWHNFNAKYGHLLLHDETFQRRLREVMKEYDESMKIHNGSTANSLGNINLLPNNPSTNSFKNQTSESSTEGYTWDDDWDEDYWNGDDEWDDAEHISLEEVKEEEVHETSKFDNFDDLHKAVVEETKHEDLYINYSNNDKDAKERDKQEGACNFLSSALVKDPEVCELAFEDLYKYYKYNYCHTFHHLVMDQNSFKKLIIRTFGVKIRSEKAIEGVRGRKQLIRGVKASPDFENTFTRYATENKIEISEEVINKSSKTEDKKDEKLFHRFVKNWTDDQLQYWIECYENGTSKDLEDLMQLSGITSTTYLVTKKYPLVCKELEARGLRS